MQIAQGQNIYRRHIFKDKHTDTLCQALTTCLGDKSSQEVLIAVLHASHSCSDGLDHFCLVSQVGRLATLKSCEVGAENEAELVVTSLL